MPCTPWVTSFMDSRGAWTGTLQQFTQPGKHLLLLCHSACATDPRHSACRLILCEILTVEPVCCTTDCVCLAAISAGRRSGPALCEHAVRPVTPYRL